MATVLHVSFRLQDGSTNRITVTQPKIGLDAATIRNQATVITNSDIFAVNGQSMTAYSGAQLVETTKIDFA